MTDILGGLTDTLSDGIQAILYATIYKLLYYIAVGCCWIIDLLYSMFEVMAGLSKVSYDGDMDYLINIFFSNTTVSKVYWGMALIGLTVGFAFAIAAVIKKMFDSSEKEKRSYGQILTALFKSVLTIVCMSLIITVVLNATTLLMQQITYVFVNADDLGKEESITYTDEQYAAMTRALNTIGNFSLNPSYNNRYSINKCFNELRGDLQYLKQQGVFDFHYITTDVEGNTVATWQSALEKIANSASLDRDLSLDVYHESVSNAILQAMDLLKVNGSFKPLSEYRRHYMASRSSLPMDRYLFLMATMRAAKNADYNISPGLTDPLRGAYYYGEKSIYDLDTVNEDFDIGVAAFDYLILLLTCWKMLETLATVILNCVGRIFNMLLLYLISPLVVAVSPLDDGGKFKQWTTAFIVQSFSVFGTVVSMRVLLLFIPMVVSSKLVLFANPIANILAKLVIVLGAFEVSEKATSLITGILADNAGWQSITAGDMSGSAKSMLAQSEKIAKGAVGFGAKAAVGAGMLAGTGAYYGVKGGIATGKGAVAGAKMIGSGGAALARKISSWRKGKGGDGGAGEPPAGGTGGTGQQEQTSTPPQSQHDNPPEQHPTTENTNVDPSLKPQTDVGSFKDRVAKLEERMKPKEENQQPPAPSKPLPTGVDPGIKGRVEALDHFMKGKQNQGAPAGNGAPADNGAPVNRPAGGQTGAPTVQRSPKIAAMADAYAAHKQDPAQNVDPYQAGQAAAQQQQPPQFQQSSRVAAMANAFNAHNLNPTGDNVDPYEAGRAAAQQQPQPQQPQQPAKRPPNSLRGQQNNH